MAHPEEGAAADITLPEGDLSIDDAAEAINSIDIEALEQEDEAADHQEVAEEELVEEIQAEQDEPEQPAIEPPASWNAEDKEQFQNLPREAQNIIVRREAERDTGFQQKAEELANQRKQYEEQVQQATGQRQMLEQQVAQLVTMALPPRPDPALLQEDPVAYLEADARYKQGLEQLNTMRQQHQAQVHQQQQLARQQQQQWLQEQQTILAEKLPDYVGPKAAEFKRDLADYARKHGYDIERLSNADALDLQILDKARRFDALQAGKPTVMDAVKDLPKVQKSSARIGKKAASMDRFTAASQKLANTGSVDDAAAAIGLMDLG